MPACCTIHISAELVLVPQVKYNNVAGSVPLAWFMGSTSGPRCMVSGWLRRNQSPESELDKEILITGRAIYWNTLSVSVSSSIGGYTALKRNLDLCIPRKGIAQPQSQFPHSSVCERSIYSHVRSTYFPAAEYINRSKKHECRYWDCTRAVPFLGIFVSNFWHCVFAVQMRGIVQKGIFFDAYSR